MTVWLLTVGEPLPTDAVVARRWRTWLLADQLIARGHQVVWWSSSFDHFTRRQRLPVDAAIAAQPGLAVWHLDGVSYRRNVSLARIRNHRQVAASFLRCSRGSQRPDAIVSSLPTIELSAAAVSFGLAHGVPVALDVRDLWPDVLLDLVPSLAKPFGYVATTPMRRQLRNAAKGATAIFGLTDEFVRWGLDAAGRGRTTLDRVFPMGYTAQRPSDEELARARAFWAAQGLDDPGGPIVCFFGTFGWMFDFDTVFEAARLLGPGVRFVLCGAGEQLGALRERARGMGNMILPGHVGQAEIWDLMRRSAAGLAPYKTFRNFADNLPNKPIEYLSAGLPIIASDVTVLRKLLEANACGLVYQSADDLAAAVSRMAADPASRNAMSQRARQLFDSSFVAERVYDDMAEHIEAIAAAGANPSGILKNVR